MKEQIEFNFKRITARRLADLNTALKAVDIDTIAEIYSQVIIKCPPEWGKPNNPETYKELPFFGEFSEIVAVMGEQSKNGKPR